MRLGWSSWWSSIVGGWNWDPNWIGQIIEDVPDLQSLSSVNDGGKSLKVCFRNLTNETLLLCWMDGSGKPHHFYEVSPYRGNSPTIRPFDVFCESKDDHIETTNCGHVFLLARSDDTSRCASTKSLDGADLIGAYRPDRIAPTAGLFGNDNADQGPILHLVTVAETSDCHKSTLSLKRLRGCCHPLSVEKRRVEPNRRIASEDGSGRYDRRNLHNTYDTYDELDNSMKKFKLHAIPVRLDPTPIDTTTKKYKQCTLGQCQWPVFVEPNWFNGDANFRECFENDLDRAISYLPQHCRQTLRETLPTPIWINRSLQYGPKTCPVNGRGMCFHPAKSWLLRNGMHPAKCEAIEVYSTKCYKESRSLWGVGGSLLHEFSHAYHFKCLKDGYSNKDVLDCYNAAMKEGLYDCVRVKGPQGPKAKAYACENAMEYFAELSTAFLGGIPHEDKTEDVQEEFNKWYPFNREQIRLHDPRAYQMLTKVWRVKHS